MPIHIFVEDRLYQPYEVLARRALGLDPSRPDRSQVLVSRLDAEDLASHQSLLRLATLSQQAGFDCMMFLMDQESSASADRADKQRAFGQAFAELCRYLASIPDNHAMKTVNPIRLVTRTCLECWLLSDPIAVVNAVAGRQGVNYQPPLRRTDALTPRQALGEIAHIIQEVGRRTGKTDLVRTGTDGVKRRGKAIATTLDLERARGHNGSLAYFLDMISCQRAGCEYPCPE